MANRLKIIFDSYNISNFNVMYIEIRNTAIGYSSLIYKRFVSGVPTELNHVRIGANILETLNNLMISLNLYDVDAVKSFRLVDEDIFIDFDVYGDYSYTDSSYMPTGFYIYSEFFDPEILPVLEALELHDLSIEIIDTYENEKPLIIENTQLGAPILSWNNGDDEYGAIMSSKLEFNMLVKDGSDGKFFHLFTGNEKRYLVKVFNLLDDESTELIWQGFLLPDLYQEPYKGGPIWVLFTAIDMLGTLKGKLLPPWFYNNRFPIMRLLSYLLDNTGLQQKFIVAPSLVPAEPFISWRNISIPLTYYVSDNFEYKDCYEILVDILTANGMTISSYRGYWFVTGISRKGEEMRASEQFLSTGIFEKYVDVENRVSEVLSENNSVSFTALTPWKKVKIDVDQSKTDSLLSDEVVVLNREYIQSLNAPALVNQGKYVTNYFNNWVFHGTVPVASYSDEKFKIRLFQFANQYVVNENISLNNYYECLEQPYVLAGAEYDFEISGEIRCKMNTGFSNGPFRNYPNFENCFVFQLFVDDIEIASNRSGYFERDKYIFTYLNNGIAYDFNIPNYGGAWGPHNYMGSLTYSLKCKLKSNIEGRLKVRLNLPVMNDSPPPEVFGWQVSDYSCDKLSIVLNKELSADFENCNANRKIQFSQEKEVSVNLTCSKNECLENNIGLQAPVSANYFYDLPISFWGGERLLKQFIVYSPSLSELSGEITIWKYFMSNHIMPLFGRDMYRKNLFVERGDGSVESAISIGGLLSDNSIVIMSALALNPIIPKKYEIIDSFDFGDVLKYMAVKYAIEYIPFRANWKIYGFNYVKSFIKILADVYHYTRPETIFAIDHVVFRCVFPDEIIQFQYMGEDRQFVPTRLTIDLSNGKTSLRAVEANFNPIEVHYE